MKKICAALLLLAAAPAAQAAITSIAWGGVDKQGVDLFTLTNKNGMEVKITNYGGIITSIRVPGRDGQVANVVEGFGSLEDYTSPGYNGRYGSLIGRYANRLMGNTFAIGGVNYKIGRDGYNYSDFNKPYDERVWTAKARAGDEPQLELNLLDRKGTMGFPGTVRATVTYTLTKDDTLRIDYRATTDKKTVINLINHSYFNMAGAAAGPIDHQTLQLFAHRFTPIDAHSIPTGEIRDVAGSDFDFTQGAELGPRLASADPQIAIKKGLDHNFVIDGPPGVLRIAARLTDPASGRRLEVWTTQPGVQVYSGNSVRPKVALAKGYVPHGAISFQTQHYPDSPNHPNFPSTELAPGRVFREVTEFRFSVAK